MLTEFGKFVRKLRIDRSELLIEMAQKLQVTPAFLSAVEVGKKNVPSGWKDELVRLYNLNYDEEMKLINVIRDSVRQLKIDLYNKNENDRNLILSFARKLETMDNSEKDTILKLLNKREEEKYG